MPCRLQVGCDEAGACFADVNGRPEMCGAYESGKTLKYVGPIHHLKGELAVLQDTKVAYRNGVESTLYYVQFNRTDLTRDEVLKNQPPTPTPDMLGFGKHEFRAWEFEEVK